ncbi:hypothetical protein [Deinococcus koreensis]|nr:hypothetical protein [Deinococcus koreensis]
MGDRRGTVVVSLNTDEMILIGESVNLTPYGCWQVLERLDEISPGVVTLRCSLCSDLKCTQRVENRPGAASTTPTSP